MAESNQKNHRSTIFLPFIAGGIFILGAALFPLLVNARQKALENAAPILAPVNTGYPAPQLVLVDLQGNPVSIDDYRGQVILVNNWATWCPPCKLEMPELQAYYAAHAKEGFVVLAIESGEPTDQVASYVQEHGLTFPVFLDPHITALEAFDNWNLPNSYIIDRQGVVRLSWTGGINQPTLEHYVTPLLEENK